MTVSKGFGDRPNVVCNPVLAVSKGLGDCQNVGSTCTWEI
jgi:hypothetical protein